MITDERTVQILEEVQEHIFYYYQGGPIDHCKHVPGPVYQLSAESEYTTSFTAGMAIAHSRMLNNEFMNNDPYVVPEQSLLIILDRKSDVCMTKNVKDTKHTINLTKRIHFLIKF